MEIYYLSSITAERKSQPMAEWKVNHLAKRKVEREAIHETWTIDETSLADDQGRQIID
jgi:hypothetical protein